MAHFYFHISTPMGAQRDSIGLELDSATIACEEARSCFREIVAEEAMNGHDVSEWVLVVENESGKRLATISHDQLLN